MTFPQRDHRYLSQHEDQRVQTLIYSPLAPGLLARSWRSTTAKSEAEAAVGRKEETNAATDYTQDPKSHGSNRRPERLAMPSLRRRGCSAVVVAAPIVGAPNAKHIEDAVASQ